MKDTKRICSIIMLLLFLVALFVLNVSKRNAELDPTAASRVRSENTTRIIIDDEAIAAADALQQNADSLFLAEAQSAFSNINTLRGQAGMTPLAWSSALEQPTRVRAAEATQLFSHTRPNGSDWWTVDSNLMYGENLAKGYSDATSAVQAWMNSPTHKANIMNAAYHTIAIAICKGKDGLWYWAQEFGY